MTAMIFPDIFID